MEKTICEEINKIEKSPKKLSENSQEDSFQSIECDQRANSDLTPSIDSNSEYDDCNRCIKNYSNDSSLILENNPINLHKLKNNGNNPINDQTYIYLLNENEGGFKGCSPFENVDQNNSINNGENNGSKKNIEDNL